MIEKAFLKMLLIGNGNVFADDARSLNEHDVLTNQPSTWVKRKANGIK